MTSPERPQGNTARQLSFERSQLLDGDPKEIAAERRRRVRESLNKLEEQASEYAVRTNPNVGMNVEEEIKGIVKSRIDGNPLLKDLLLKVITRGRPLELILEEYEGEQREVSEREGGQSSGGS